MNNKPTDVQLDIYENAQTYYSMRMGEGANETDAWQLACEQCEDEYNERCQAAREALWEAK